MKRFLSLFLAFAMCFSLTAPAFAATSEKNDYDMPSITIDAIDGGDMYTQRTDGKAVAIMTNDELHLIEISIKYAGNENVYHWSINDYPLSVFHPADPAFWTDIISYAEARMDQATAVIFLDVTYDEPIDVTEPRGASAGSDLRSDLRVLYGNEYTGKLLSFQAKEGHYYRLYETMEFLISTNGTKSWSTVVTLSDIVVNILGLTSVSVPTICSVLGIVASATTLIPPGKINRYICTVQYTRYVTIDDSAREYSYAQKFITYKGFEDADINSENRAYVATEEEPPVIYGSTEVYYNCYSCLFSEAYKCYMNLPLGTSA